MAIYILATAVILAGAALAVAFLFAFTKSVRDVSNVPVEIAKTSKETLVGGTHEVGKTVTEVVSVTAKTAENLLQPISNAIGRLGDSLAERLRSSQTELSKSRAEVINLSQEVEMLRSRRISVDQVKNILQLALIEAGFTRYNIKKMRVGGDEGGPLSRKEEIEYFGIIKATYTQKLGVDLDKLKFQVVSAGVVSVSGLGQTEIIGTHSIDIHPFHTELRRHLTGGTIRGNVSEIIPGDPDRTLNTQEWAQTQEIINEINADKATEQIDNAIDKLALSFLQWFFAPAGYQVVRATENLVCPKSFQMIATELNNRVDQLIQKRMEDLQAANKKCHIIEGQLMELIDSNADQMKAEVFRVGTSHGVRGPGES